MAGDHDGSDVTKGDRLVTGGRTQQLQYIFYSSSPERAGGESSLLSGQAAVRSDDLDSVSGFDHVHQVVVQDDVHRARQLSSGGFLWHLLHRDGLVVLVDGEPKLCLQRVVLLILPREEEEEEEETLRSSLFVCNRMPSAIWNIKTNMAAAGTLVG